MVVLGVSFCLLLSASRELAVSFQAHRGGLGELPENTMAAYRASWQLGALPEVDVRATSDGVVICLHDATLRRTSDAPEDIRKCNVSELTAEDVRRWDVGKKFGAAFAGERVPLLAEVLAEMKGHPERQIYVDFKDAPLDRLAALLHDSGVIKQVIFCHNSHEICRSIRIREPEIRTMLWIGGKPEEIQAAYAAAAATRFDGLNQVQLHLHAKEQTTPIEYELPAAFLAKCLEETEACQIDLEVLPFGFDDSSLGALLDMGIHWYATDYPKRLADAIQRWRNQPVGTTAAPKAPPSLP